jgi:hypothetical protein
MPTNHKQAAGGFVSAIEPAAEINSSFINSPLNV